MDFTTCVPRGRNVAGGRNAGVKPGPAQSTGARWCRHPRRVCRMNRAGSGARIGELGSRKLLQTPGKKRRAPPPKDGGSQTGRALGIAAAQRRGPVMMENKEQGLFAQPFARRHRKSAVNQRPKAKGRARRNGDKKIYSGALKICVFYRRRSGTFRLLQQEEDREV